MRSALALGGLVVVGGLTIARAEILVETFTSRSAFEARLGNVAVVDFDDVSTSGDAPVAIANDRYAAQGVVINGQSGQYVSRTFGDPTNYPPASPPNMYAPGPIDDVAGGGSETNVQFRAGDVGGAVAGFGAVFIDLDSQDLLNIFPSSLDAFDADNFPRGSVEATGNSAQAVFRGIVTVDGTTGNPVPVITRVQLTNGGGWPAGTLNQGVPLDDFVFSAPATTTTTTTNTPSSTTSTTLVACPATPVVGCRQSLIAGAARLNLTDSTNDPRDAMSWRWTRGAVGDGEFRQATSRDVFLCLYDGTSLRFDATIPAGALCGSRACWRAAGKRVLYRDRSQSRRGIVQVILAAGPSGSSQSQIVWLGQGAKLKPPAPPLTTPVTVQMVSGGGCYEAVFSAARKNAPGRFRARSD